MVDVKEIGIWAIAFGSIVGVVAAKPFKSYSTAEAANEEVYELELLATTNEVVVEAESETETEVETEAETLADIETYLEAWCFAERANTMSMDLSEADITALQKVAIAEAGIDGVEGEALVIRVVLNRVYSDEFPNSVTEVIEQENQFTSYSNGTYQVAIPDETSAEAWSMVENGWDESQGAMWFERSSNEATWHSENLTYLFSYGGHSFYSK